MLYDSEKGDFIICLTGDSMLSRRLSIFGEDTYKALVDILRGADATFTNLETTVHRWDEGSPGISRGTFMTTEPWLLEELKWMGINMVSCANNHAFDYGESGVLATIKYLDEACLAHAGTGKNLAEARAPGYLDTPHGRVALIAATSTFSSWSRAGEQRPDMKGRPGVNPLTFETVYTTDSVAFQELRRIAGALGFSKESERNRLHFFSPSEIPAEKGNEIHFLGKRFVLAEAFSISTQANLRDVKENLRSIQEARRQADWVVMSLHCHEFGGESFFTAQTRSEQEELADFVQAYAHDAIDAGADLFACHGSHTPLGVEIYKGSPIFYSLGNFIFQNETVRFFPAEAYERFDLDAKATPADFLDARTNRDTKGHPANPLFWENIIAVCNFRGRKLEEVKLYPIDQGHGRPRAQRGRPALADESTRNQIIERLQRVSRRYGTEISRRDGVGIIKI